MACAGPLPLTFWHWAGVSPYTWGFPLAETCVFVKQSLEPFHCDLCCQRHPFSRSYGVRLPSSLTRVLSRALVSSTCLPVSVCGTVTGSLARGFSGRIVRPVGLAVKPRFLPVQIRAKRRIFLPLQTLTANTNYQQSCGALLSASPHRSSRNPVVPEYQPASHRLPRFTRTRLRTDSPPEDEPS